jgi:hypothetical protein
VRTYGERATLTKLVTTCRLKSEPELRSAAVEADLVDTNTEEDAWYWGRCRSVYAPLAVRAIRVTARISSQFRRNVRRYSRRSIRSIPVDEQQAAFRAREKQTRGSEPDADGSGVHDAQAYCRWARFQHPGNGVLFPDRA